MRVETQKAENRTRLDQRNAGDGQIAGDGAEHREGAQAQQREPACQSVQPVRQVDGVGDPDQEHEREGPGQGLRQHDPAAKCQPLDAHVADHHA